MPTIKTDKYDEITIDGEGNVLVKTVTEHIVVHDDGTEEEMVPKFHRRVITPDDNVDNETVEIRNAVQIARSQDRMDRKTARDEKRAPPKESK